MFEGHFKHLKYVKKAKVDEHGRRTADIPMKSEGVPGDRIAAEGNLYRM